MADSIPLNHVVADDRPASETILDTPTYWFRLAEEDQRNNPDLVAAYLRMAALMERYAELKLRGLSL